MMNTTKNTPRHCWYCLSFEECEQSQNMMPDTEPVDAYLGNAEYRCESHYFAAFPDADPQAFEDDGLMGNAGESDTPEHCVICGVPLKCSLTTDGIEYVKDAIAEGAGCCRELWPVLFKESIS